ncbi:MAG: hypothetical protein LBS11_11610 [Oscillospiraceae bacterium]|nr:hypothetical protein [Oscillospiraceae bacterium]
MHSLSCDTERIEDSARYLSAVDNCARAAVDEVVSILKLVVLFEPERVFNIVDISRLKVKARAYSTALDIDRKALFEAARTLEEAERSVARESESLPDIEEMKPPVLPGGLNPGLLPNVPFHNKSNRIDMPWWMCDGITYSRVYLNPLQPTFIATETLFEPMMLPDKLNMLLKS